MDHYRRGMLTQMFYVTNWYHDELFELGFDEAAANFQATNFSGMGLGNDRVLADGQDSSSTNNANFATPPDGTSGRMQMFRFDFPTIDRDSALDSEILIHELTHGTTNRLVGNAAGLNWDPAASMGEGWGDFYALSLLNDTNADDPDGNYGSGGYATYKLGGLLDNYLYGIRRFPYSTDNTVNPLTWGDVDDVSNNLSGGIAPSPLDFNSSGGMEVHNAGELWALSLWEMRSRIIADPAGANGSVPAGNATSLQLVTDGLKMTPIDPSFIDARDALVDADCATNACANEAHIWGAFADRGLGYGAVAPYYAMFGFGGSHMALAESFEVPKLDIAAPADVVIDDSASNNNGSIDPGEALRLSVRLTNPWRATGKSIPSATATLSTATPGVTIHDASSVYGAIPATGNALGDAFVITVAPTVACGSLIEFTLSTTSALGTTQVTFSRRVGAVTGNGAPVVYTVNPTPDLAITDFAPRGVQSTLVVADDFEIADLDLRVDSITHTWNSDITVMLRSPDAVGVDVVNLIGAAVAGTDNGDNITNMVIDDDLPLLAVNDMTQATAAMSPFTKSWLPVFNAPWATVSFGTPPDPVGNLSRHDGKSTRGTWTLLVSDPFEFDTGTLNQWSMHVTPKVFGCTAFVPSVVVAASKTVSGTFRTGNTVTYTVTLANNGTAGQADLAGPEFVDVLPAGLTLVSANASSGTATATIGTRTVEWNGALAPLGGSVTITITATIDGGTQGTSLSNQGTVNVDSDGNGTPDTLVPTNDPGTAAANDPTVFTVDGVSFTASKTVTTAGGRGSAVTYTVVLSNTGNVASVDVPGADFVDTLPAGLTLTGASATLGTASIITANDTATWSGSVPAGGAVTITIDATVDAAAQGTISNQGTLVYDANLDNAQDTVLVTDDPSLPGAADATSFDVQIVDLSLDKTVAGSFLPNGTVTYTLLLANAGNRASPDNATAEVVDVVPAGLTVTGANATSGTASFAGNTVSWNGSVAGGGNVTITIQATQDPATSGSVSNQATAFVDVDLDGDNDTQVPSDDPGLPGSADPTVFVVAGADLQIAKSNGSNGVRSGLDTTYTIQVSNGGPQPALGARVQDTLPAGLENGEWTCSAVGTTCPAASGSGNLDVLVDLPVNAVVTFQFVVTVSPAASGTVTNTASVTAPAGLPELDASDNSASDTDMILPIGIFRDGFELLPPVMLKGPASEKTRRLLEQQ